MKTLYKRIAHAMMALVMLVSLTTTVYAAEGYGFTTDDEPAEIYAIILRDHGKIAADEYKYALMLYSGATGENPRLSVDDYEIGHKDQYAVSDLQKALNHVPNRIDTTATKTETTSTTETPSTGTNNSVDYASPEAQAFDDVKPGSWYYEAVNAMAAGGLLTGYTDGLFHPDDPITIAQYSTVFAKIYGIHSTEWDWNWVQMNRYEPVYDQNGKLIAIEMKPCYVDENGNPFPGAIEPLRESHHWAQEDQINIVFMAQHHEALQHEVLDEPIIRGQMLTEMFTLYVNKYGASSAEKTWTMDDIPDADLAKNGRDILRADALATGNWKRYVANQLWGYASILRAYDANITTGVDDNHTCNPFGIVTRAQFCQMLYNMDITTANSVPLPKGGLM